MSTQSQKTEIEQADGITFHTRKDVPKLDITMKLKGKPDRFIEANESLLYPLVDDLVNAFGKKSRSRRDR